MTFVALYQGICPDRPLMTELARKLPDTLQKFMDKVEEFINQEEALVAIISSRPPVRERKRTLGKLRQQTLNRSKSL
jgi:nucleoside-triphosphatase THEP1